MQPFYFTVVFWGEVHRNYCTDLLMASLLSPGNIPALNPERKSKFLIVTTKHDWVALQSNEIFNQLKRYVEPVWLEMPFPGPGESKMLVMSEGHRLVSIRAFDDGAYGVFTTPDLVLSDGSVAAMERLAEAGKKVVLSVAIRFAQETLLDEMEREGYLKSGQPLVLPSRDLMRMALQHLHTETLRYEFDAPCFADQPISVYWWVPGGDGVVIHSFSWAPLLVDYAVLHAHDTSTFKEWTLDGDYIFRNFPDPQDVYVVTDSDEILLVSFTKEADLHFELNPRATIMPGWVLKLAKLGRIQALRGSRVMDPLKRQIFSLPVFLHSGEISPAWTVTIRKAAGLLRQSDNMPPIVRKVILFLLKVDAMENDSGILLSRLRIHLHSKLYWLILCVWPVVKPVLERVRMTAITVKTMTFLLDRFRGRRILPPKQLPD